MREAADAMGVAVATAKRRWVYARSWLYAELIDSVVVDAASGKPPVVDGDIATSD